MDYFIKSLWFGALLQPRCWRCAFMRNPMMLALIMAGVFFGLNWFYPTPIYSNTSILLLCSWLVGMVLFIITPRRYYKLTHDEKEQYVFFYDIYRKWVFDVKEDNRESVLRTFEKNGQTIKKIGSDFVVNGYDDCFEQSGFLLVCFYPSSWVVLGNGYSLSSGKTLILGNRVAKSVFVFHSKQLKLHVINGQKVISKEIMSFETCDSVEFDAQTATYQELGYVVRLDYSTSKLAQLNGEFILFRIESVLRLLKMVCLDGQSIGFLIFANPIHVVQNGQRTDFQKSVELGYVLKDSQV